MGRVKFTSREHFGSICCLGVTNERASEFISGAKDSSIKVWNSSGKCLRTMRNHRGAVHSISFLEEGDEIIVPHVSYQVPQMQM